MFLDQKDSRPRAINPCSSSNPMNVIVWILWRVNLNNVMNVIKVNPSGDNICCNQAPILLLSKTIENSCPSLILQFAMNSLN